MRDSSRDGGRNGKMERKEFLHLSMPGAAAPRSNVTRGQGGFI